MRQEGGLPGTRVPRNARSVLGDHSFGSNDADFVLFGVMTEEIHWLPVRGRSAPCHTSFPEATPAPSSLRERRSRARHCGAPVLSPVRTLSCGPSRRSAVSGGLLRRKGRVSRVRLDQSANPVALVSRAHEVIVETWNMSGSQQN